ncbi:methyltransferase, FkbM family [Tistlia consotensis]|uniref:Methyltransferase, FkbM family n=1 Tax=Tistlia consotensis USBA 355 TaxID=560819 RepID=A0A1Y6B8K6_9PROT|nr:FkbM family methyltransferase [Tistlia consotensis]SME98562.1 methyltransferase, FkbM family [Tistlia consotensis USBA 355]SNR57948.1 methyltransferase, FkbM family [Tistlia consotensis]
MSQPIARRVLYRLKRLLPKPAEKPVGPEEQFQRLLKTVRKLHIQKRHKVVRTALESMTERDVIDSLQGFHQVKRLDYEKAEVRLHTETRSSWLRHRAARKEPWTIAWIESCLAGGEVLYDIGANTGVYSLLAAKLHGPELRVVAFEPAFANFADLNRNIVLNRLERQVTPLPFALSDRDQLLSFGFRNLEAGSAMHGSEETVGKGDEAAAHVLPVVGRRLDALVETLGLPLPQHVKIDVDGGELEVLAGGSASFADPALKTVMIEVTSTPGMAAEVDRFFAERGLTKAREFHKPTAHGEAERCWYGLYARDPAGLPSEAFEGLDLGR